MCACVREKYSYLEQISITHFIFGDSLANLTVKSL